jgi:hypothetical protein
MMRALTLGRAHCRANHPCSADREGYTGRRTGGREGGRVDMCFSQKSPTCQNNHVWRPPETSRQPDEECSHDCSTNAPYADRTE